MAGSMEVSLADFMPVLTGFYTPVFMHGEGVIGLAAWKLDLRPIQQSAVAATLRAADFDLANHPPRLSMAGAWMQRF
jgi:hypothetical protein